MGFVYRGSGSVCVCVCVGVDGWVGGWSTRCILEAKVYNRSHIYRCVAPPLPLLYLEGFYDDWRDGMEQFADMQHGNGGKPVPLPAGFDASPPAGWNSWAMVRAKRHSGREGR